MSRRGAERPAAVILGGSENTLSAARSLGPRGIRVHILGDGLGTRLARYSRFVSSFLTVGQRAQRFERWSDWLESGPRDAVVLPGGDTGLEFIAQHGTWLGERGYCPIEASDAVTLAMLDKSSTYRLARDAGFDVPRTATVDAADDLTAAVTQIGFPCALKPCHSYRFFEVFGAKAVVVHGPDDLRRSFAAIHDAGLSVLVTEIVTGVDDSYSSYYTYLDDRGEPLLHFTKRKLRQYPIGFGGGTYHVSHWDAEVADVGLHFFQAIGLRGIGNVEFKRDRRDGRLKLIECNPRLTAADALVRRAGVDLPYLAYQRAIGEEPDPMDGFRDGVRLWYPANDFQAFRAYRDSGHLTTRRWLASLAHVQHFPLFDRRDVRPSVMAAGGRVRRLLRVPRRDAAPPTVERMRLSSTPALTTRAVARLGRFGPVGRRLALHLDRRRFRGARSIRVRPAHEALMASYQAAWYRRTWEEAARAVGAVVEEPSDGRLVIRRRSSETVVSLHRLMLDPPDTIALALDKARVHRLLLANDVPVPDYVDLPASDRPAGREFLARQPGRCVVKPADGAGGGGVTCSVETVDDLWRAWLAASELSSRVLVERAVPGDEYRLLFLDGQLLDVVRRSSPTVLGDARSSVGDLIAAENQRRLDDGGRTEVTRLLHVDLDCALTLRHRGLSLPSVPDEAAVVPVKRAVSDNAAADNVTVRDLPEEIVAVAATAARVTGLRLAGVDLVTPDASRPLAEAGGAVLEVNGTPGLHYHYQVADRDAATPVAVPVLDALLSAS